VRDAYAKKTAIRPATATAPSEPDMVAAAPVNLGGVVLVTAVPLAGLLGEAETDGTTGTEPDGTTGTTGTAGAVVDGLTGTATRLVGAGQ